MWVTFPHFRHLGCSGRPCPLADLGDSRILRDGDSISTLDIFTVALPSFGFVRLFVRFLYWHIIAGNSYTIARARAIKPAAVFKDTFLQ